MSSATENDSAIGEFNKSSVSVTGQTARKRSWRSRPYVSQSEATRNDNKDKWNGMNSTLFVCITCFCSKKHNFTQKIKMAEHKN